MTISFTKVKLKHGWLGNMAGEFPIVHPEFGEFKTTEALFQAMRFPLNHPMVEIIRNEKSPFTAKVVAKKNASEMVVPQLSQRDVDNMRVCLRLKINAHPELKDLLLATGEHTIIEDVTKRQGGSGLFWGAARMLPNSFDEEKPEHWDVSSRHWVGDNWLGVCWMEIRNELNGINYEPKTVPSLAEFLEKEPFKAIVIGGLKAAIAAHPPNITRNNMESAGKRVAGFVRGYLSRYSSSDLFQYVVKDSEERAAEEIARLQQANQEQKEQILNLVAQLKALKDGNN